MESIIPEFVQKLRTFFHAKRHGCRCDVSIHDDGLEPFIDCEIRFEGLSLDPELIAYLDRLNFLPGTEERQEYALLAQVGEKAAEKGWIVHYGVLSETTLAVHLLAERMNPEHP